MKTENKDYNSILDNMNELIENSGSVNEETMNLLLDMCCETLKKIHKNMDHFEDKKVAA